MQRRKKVYVAKLTSPHRGITLASEQEMAIHCLQWHGEYKASTRSQPAKTPYKNTLDFRNMFQDAVGKDRGVSSILE